MEFVMESIRPDKDERMAARTGGEGGGGGRMVLGLIAAAGVLSVAIYFWWQWNSAESDTEQIAVPPVVSAPPTPIATPSAEPAIQHPVEAAQPAEPLPVLDESDGSMARAIAALVGDKAFGALFLSENIVRHIVATVDNLPREAAPVKMWPVRSVGSWLDTAGGGDALVVGSKNAARYSAYVTMVKGIDAQKLAASYRQHYPLFQEAYRDLGYPKGYFNDRLIAAIDDLLATPEQKAPLRLVQVKVRYQFADPDLEHRSAGQKIMLRIGVENARVVKAKLREFRAAVAKQGM
jgi:hypothetical protein